jgi:hypothetical protein
MSVAQVQVQTSDCCGPEICTVFAVCYVCRKLEHYAYGNNVVSVVVPILRVVSPDTFLPKFVMQNYV